MIKLHSKTKGSIIATKRVSRNSYLGGGYFQFNIGKETIFKLKT